MKDTIFKPLTHLDRQGPDANNDRFQRRDNTNYHDGAFQNMDTDSIHEQRGWTPDETPADTRTPADEFEANGCLCPDHNDDQGVYTETIVVEYYGEIE